MPDFFSGLTGALTAGRTGQLEGQNQGALTNFAIQMQLAQLARERALADAQIGAEGARSEYYRNEGARNDAMQRRADALAGIQPQQTMSSDEANQTANDINDTLKNLPFGAGAGVQVPALPSGKTMTGTAVSTGKTDEQGNLIEQPLQDIGNGQVYNPSANLNAQLTQQKLEAAMERERAREEAAMGRAQFRVSQGPLGTRTADTQAANRLLLQQVGIYSKPHPGPVGGINEPALPPEQALQRAKEDVATLYPDLALQRWTDNPGVQAAARRGRAARNQFQAPAQAGGGIGGMPGTFNPAVPIAPPAAVQPSAAGTPAIRPDVVAKVIAHVKANPIDINAVRSSKSLTPEEKAAIILATEGTP